MPTRETTLSVPDMRCEGCTKRVTNVLERLKGVRSSTLVTRVVQPSQRMSGTLRVVSRVGMG